MKKWGILKSQQITNWFLEVTKHGYPFIFREESTSPAQNTQKLEFSSWDKS